MVQPTNTETFEINKIYAILTGLFFVLIIAGSVYPLVKASNVNKNNGSGVSNVASAPTGTGISNNSNNQANSANIGAAGNSAYSTGGNGTFRCPMMQNGQCPMMKIMQEKLSQEKKMNSSKGRGKMSQKMKQRTETN
ncbi:MAG TPA: hypothetical protein QF753_18425 [Victivallales bacterium]|nr:hypothetical protein [Victivallales bacterium]